jgi:hypothetical protein
MFHGILNRFGGSSFNTELVLLVSRPTFFRFGESRAWAFSSHGADAIEPLTPLSQPLIHLHASLTFVRAALWPYAFFWNGWYGSEDV